MLVVLAAVLDCWRAPAGVWTEIPGVRGLAGEKRSERSWGAAISGEDVGESSQRALVVEVVLRVAVAGVALGRCAACCCWRARRCVCGVACTR